MASKSVWDALIDDPDKANDLKERNDYLILIKARLNGQPGSEADKANQYGLEADQVHDLMKGKMSKFSLPDLIAIARKIGITAKV